MNRMGVSGEDPGKANYRRSGGTATRDRGYGSDRGSSRISSVGMRSCTIIVSLAVSSWQRASNVTFLLLFLVTAKDRRCWFAAVAGLAGWLAGWLVAR